MILFCQICNAHQAHVYKGEQRFPRTTVQLWNCEQCDGTRSGPSPLQNATELLTAEQLATYQEMPLADLRTVAEQLRGEMEQPSAVSKVRQVGMSQLIRAQVEYRLREWGGVLWLIIWREVQEG